MTAVSEVSEGKAVALHDTPPHAIVRLLELALEKGTPIEALERLQALYERVTDRAAAMEFAGALAAFQNACPPIKKTSSANIVSKNGGQYSYKYAELDEIARTIRPHLQSVGLSYSWDSETKDRNTICRCTLRHVNGHSVTASFACPTENPSAMSDQQKHAAALTYARRQSLIQVLGLTTTDPDSDGANPEPITEDQAIALDDLIKEKGIDLGRFLKWAGVSKLGEIPQRNYAAAIRAIDQKAAEKAKGAAK